MKLKREEKHKWYHSQPPEKNNRLLPLILICLIPISIATAHLYRIPARFIVPSVVMMLWVVGAMLLWQRATA
jgi:hypothetical protein